MKETLAAWIAARDADVPEPLRARIHGVIDGSCEADASALVESACAALADSLELGDDRAAAVPLLAADALLTWACEAAVDGGMDVEAFATRACQRLATLLAEASE